MTVDVAALKRRAKRRLRTIARKRADPRYRRVMGRLVAAGVLTTNDEVPKHRERIAVEDALWVGDVEPRVIELLPALIIKKPALFVDPKALPPDVRSAVTALRRGDVPEALRGIPGDALGKWVPRVGHKGKRPSRLKSFRMTPDDVALLQELSESLGVSETVALRRALRALARDLPRAQR